MIKFLRSNEFVVLAGKKSRYVGIYNAVRDFNPDIVYFDWVHSFIVGRSFVWSCIKSLLFISQIFYLYSIKKKPIIHTLHNTQNHIQLWLFLEQLVYGFFLRRCLKVRVYSDAVKQEVIQKFNILPDRIYIIQDIPYHRYYTNNCTKKESRAYLNIPENTFVFLFFGKIKTYKGLENLIQSFLLTAQPNNFLLIAGDSADQNYILNLKNQSSDSPEIIWFDHFISKDEVQYFFNAADVVVLPFIRIDHSGTIDLAMSFSKPVITLKTDMTTSLLAHQKMLLFEKPQDLTDCMAMAHHVNLMEMGIQNFKIADNTNYRELLELFQKS